MDLTDPGLRREIRSRRHRVVHGRGGGGNQGYCWPWASFVLSALGAPNGPPGRRALGAFQVWKAMPEWEEEAPEPPPGQLPVHANDARRRLADLLQASIQGKAAEPRPQQSDYASAVSTAFTPRAQPGTPNLVLAEAGTGVGKTLGYLAPASLWAEKNRGAVWISTYTRNLQHQIDRELDRLLPDPAVKAAQGRAAQGPRELPVPAEPGGGGRRPAQLQPPYAHGAGPDGALGAPPPATATCRAATSPAGCPIWSAAAADHDAGRPARRMHLFRLPALPQLLHREQRPRGRARPTSSSPTMPWS